MRSALVALVVFGFAIWFWAEARRHHEHATRIVRVALRSSGAQLLDDTVSLQSIGLARTESGRLGIRRTFGFELSFDRFNRERGSVTLLGRSTQILDIPDQEPLP